MTEMEKDHGKQIWKKRQLAKLGEMIDMDNIDELHDWDDFIVRNWNYAAEPTLSEY